VSILLTSILDTALHPEPSGALFMVNMLVGRTSFNIILLLGALAFSRHQDIKKITVTIYKSMKAKIMGVIFGN